MLKKQYNLRIEFQKALGPSTLQWTNVLEKEPTEAEIEGFMNEILDSKKIELNGEILLPIIKKAYVETFYTKVYPENEENQL